MGRIAAMSSSGWGISSNGKAGFLGLGRDEWIREEMERETAEGIPLQQRWKKEYEASKPDANSKETTNKK